ncbi:Pentatricopeptide repeat-containing protein [Sesamum alatum]|uniref:Pentatricopeptide repeat-containing protein n=1 Tax=Sesamum alatum TaxID=300844 RepID=A0AAE1Y3U6_9LAMI|nr:Pentatricopeptide repeat-containing protein [Sesamum alatum]
MSKRLHPSIFKKLNIAVRYLSQPFDRHSKFGGKNPPLELLKLRQIHSLLIVSGFSHHSSFLTGLLLHCLSLPSFPCAYAVSIFDQIRDANVFTYNALIRGFSSDPQNAIFVYVKMRQEGVLPNKHTFPLLLKSKSKVPFQIFAQAIKFGFGSDHFARNSLVSSLSNCGLIEGARQVFDEMTRKDVVAYTALMDGYVRNARAFEALELFLEMRVLGVCVDEPTVDHYGCMVDLLGRAGHLHEAAKLIEAMPMEPSAGIWGALFGACMIHKDYELGRIIGNHLIRLQPYHSGRYALLANLYSKCRNWEAAANVRKKMNEVGVEKTRGCSWIESNGVLHEFVAFEKSHVASETVYCILDNLTAQIQQLPFLPDASLLEL